jgi:acetyltransferase-like isoleucine patch superfamily enzyme
MGFLVKLFFKLNSLALTLANKYRLPYLKHVYQERLVLGHGIQFDKGSTIIFFSRQKLAKLAIGLDCIFRRRCTIAIEDMGQIVIGDRNFFNNDCSITCLGKITIGDNNLFGESVKLYDHNHNFADNQQLVRDQGFKTGEITIGNNCWIGSNCVILNNVTIGDNVVIGANNLIYKSVPSNTIVKAAVQSVAVLRK